MPEQAKPRAVIAGRIGSPQPAVTSHKVYLATPAYGSAFSAEYVRSLFMLLSSRPTPPIEYVFSYFDYADIVMARNYLVSDFYYNYPGCSHILFVDDDMGFDAGLVSEMLALNEKVVGALYPKRRLDLRKLHAAGDLPFEKALARSTGFIGSVTKPAQRRGEFIRVSRCGTGIMLISRTCLDEMVARLPDLVDLHRFKPLPGADKFRRFLTPFDKIKEAGMELSEDFSFCKRWVDECGGTIWAHASRNIRHAGSLVVDTRYADNA